MSLIKPFLFLLAGSADAVEMSLFWSFCLIKTSRSNETSLQLCHQGDLTVLDLILMEDCMWLWIAFHLQGCFLFFYLYKSNSMNTIDFYSETIKHKYNMKGTENYKYI